MAAFPRNFAPTPSRDGKRFALAAPSSPIGYRALVKIKPFRTQEVSTILEPARAAAAIRHTGGNWRAAVYISPFCVHFALGFLRRAR
jgi:hypothetical protein